MFQCGKAPPGWHFGVHAVARRHRKRGERGDSETEGSRGRSRERRGSKGKAKRSQQPAFEDQPIKTTHPASSNTNCRSRARKTRRIVFPTNAALLWLLPINVNPWERGKPFYQQVWTTHPLPGQLPSKTQRFPRPHRSPDGVVSHTGPGPWSSIKAGDNGLCKHKESEEVVPSLGGQLVPMERHTLSPPLHPPGQARKAYKSLHLPAVKGNALLVHPC